MKERKRHKLCSPVNLWPGDTFIAEVTEGGKKEKFQEKIDRRIGVDTVVTFDVEDGDFGLSEGIGAAFGKEQL